LAESRLKTGRQAEAPALALKALAAEKAAGRKAPEAWYKHAVAMAYDSKNPQSVELAREWISAYPSATNWRDALRILASESKLPENDLIDVYRLQLATKALAGTADYARFANLSSKLGYPGETEAVIKAGIAAGALNASNSEVASMLKVATGKVGADKAGLAAATAKALSSGNAKLAMAQGDANYGYGNYAKAAEVYRAVAGMSGADVATANLRLGMALAMAGDKAGAEAALKAVTGPKTALAQYWLAYAASRA
jgi:tetratricopeptide (TPR) repeat protein